MCDPTVNTLVVHAAVPFESATLEHNVLLFSSVKEAVPVGVPDPGARAETVAVKVTAEPTADGFSEDVTTVTLEAWSTACVSTAEMLPALEVSPE